MSIDLSRSRANNGVILIVVSVGDTPNSDAPNRVGVILVKAMLVPHEILVVVVKGLWLLVPVY